VVADEHEPVGAVGREEGPGLGELAGLVDDGHVELAGLHRPRATGGGRRRDDGGLAQVPGDPLGVARLVEQVLVHVRADAGLRADPEDVLEPLVAERLQRVVDRSVRERRQQHALAPLHQRPHQRRQRVRFARPRRAVNQREVLGVQRQVDRLVLGGVVVDVRLVVVAERGLAPAEQHVLAPLVAGEDRVV